MQAQRNEASASTHAANLPADKLADLWFSQVSSELLQLRAAITEPPRDVADLRRADEAVERLQALTADLASRPALTADQLRTKASLMRDLLDGEGGLAEELAASLCRDIDAMAAC